MPPGLSSPARRINSPRVRTSRSPSEKDSAPEAVRADSSPSECPATVAGLDMGDLLRIGLPPEFRGWAAADTEYLRSVAHLFARYERAVLLPLR